MVFFCGGHQAGEYYQINNIEFDKWHEIQLKWNVETAKFKVKFDDENWSDELSFPVLEIVGINRFYISSNISANVFVDNIFEPLAPPPEKWSFAIITDLHIGRGYLDYGGKGTDDCDKPWLEVSAQNYYLTERLKGVVKWVNENTGIDKHNIKFVVVTGDISDSGECSELKRVREILDSLEIPYFPVIGSHDVWSWYAWQDEKSKMHKTEETPIGDTYFNKIFDESFLEQQLGKLDVSWQDMDEDPQLQNYAFEYGEIKFILLDFVPRDPTTGEIERAYAARHEETMKFLNNSLSRGGSVVLLSHHPMIARDIRHATFDDNLLKELENIVKEVETKFGTTVLTNFAGHIHGYYDELHRIGFVPGFVPGPDVNPVFMNANIDYKEEGYPTPTSLPVVTTEALMTASNEPDPKGIIRFVEIKDNKTPNYDLIEGGEEFRALNPYFKEIEWSPRLEIEWSFPPKAKPIWEVEFELYAFNKLYPLAYTLDFGDGFQESIEVPERLYPPIEFEHNYPKEGGTYKIEFVAEKSTLNVKENITRDITLPHWKWGFFTLSPVDIILIDPDGLVTSKQINEIPGAIYFETDLDKDGDLDDIIILSDRKIGDYFLTIIPEPDASPTNTYTSGVLAENNTTIFMAENVQISNIPNLPYIIRSAETEIIPITPATIDFDPDTLNLKSKGRWVTAYIELPMGHGYGVDEINPRSVMLNTQVQAEVKPTGIGDYDNDGIPDLMVKFNRSEVQSILPIGEKIKITIAGNLIDGRLFEGVDFIRVIFP